MNIYATTDKQIEAELGYRIKALRLRRNISQKELANNTMLSLNSIKSLEAGKAKLSTLIAVLRELRVLDQLDNFIPENLISPLQLLKMRGKERKRASGSRSKNKKSGDAAW